MSGNHAGHDHGHVHEPGNYNRAFAIGIALNVAFVIVEAVYGVLASSLALLADAGHNLSDVLGLLLAWGALALARRRPTTRFTYGLRSSSILAALANAMLLLLACGAIMWEAVQRFGTPAPVQGTTVMIVAAIGIGVNGITAWMFMSGRRTDLNIRGAFLHMAADAAVSLGVVLGGLAILLSGWHWIDSMIGLVIVAVILVGTWGLLRDAINLALNAVPTGIDMASVQTYLCDLPGVTEVHDLHVWGMSTTEAALTAHLVMPGGHPGDRFMADAAEELEHHFRIHHATLQIELGEVPHDCALV
ncbi:MAG: cation transporter [Betaproteobacteria bacterium]|nr:cation transporter [Betaproteobacteria bacterium]